MAAIANAGKLDFRKTLRIRRFILFLSFPHHRMVQEGDRNQAADGKGFSVSLEDSL
ncbi:MAG TPA: hypothetical protein VG297_22315 [Bryobacteraceae bacterium]|jgi:hypothetical protein|nr:hypothetical protein [Bryobacteraceae bacterium]